MPVAGILFDKDGTLVDFDATWGAASHAVMALMSEDDASVQAKLAAAMHYRPESRSFLPTSPMISGSTADYVHLWAEALGRAGDPGLADEIDRHFGSEALRALTPLGRPSEIMAELRRRGLRLGLATNDAEDSARKQAERMGLLPYLDFIVGYDSGHGGKPDPGMVIAFARLLAVAPEQVALVGDSVHDLVAARAAGAIGIAVLSGPAGRSVLEPYADHVIADLAALPDLLDRLGVSRRIEGSRMGERC